jgi:hypothetical protein
MTAIEKLSSRSSKVNRPAFLQELIMSVCTFAPWSICAATLFSATVFAEPPDVRRMKPVKFKTESVKVTGASACNGPGTVCASFYAQSYDDPDNGERQATIYVRLDDGSHFAHFITCTGAQYADMLKYDEKTLKFTLDGTLDPLKDPSCVATSNSAVVVNLSGGSDGTYRDSSAGRGTITTEVSKTKYKFEHDVFSGTATGTNGYYQGDYNSVDFDVTRTTERTKAED